MTIIYENQMVVFQIIAKKALAIEVAKWFRQETLGL